MQGFLKLGGSWEADLNLVIQLAMGILLVAGMLLARAKKYGMHRACQTFAVLVGLIMVVLVMVPSFHRNVSGHIAAASSDSYYLWPLVHAGIGTIAAALGAYIVLSAGTPLLPKAIRIRNFKLWMRTALVFWCMAIVLGIGTYRAWYVAAPKPTTSVAVKSHDTVQIKFSNFEFDPKEISVPAGTTVEWINSGGRHTIEADNGSFKSDTLLEGGIFKVTFDKPGAFPYYCGNHGAKGGMLMSGVVNVTEK